MHVFIIHFIEKKKTRAYFVKYKIQTYLMGFEKRYRILELNHNHNVLATFINKFTSSKVT